jgi:rhodanese-related sulfurtransferase
MTPRTVDEALAEARSRLDRYDPTQAAAALERGALVIDTRSELQRRTDGIIPGVLVLHPNVLEWRLDPTSSAKLPQATDHDIEIVLFCDEGYASSLAAARLQDLGLRRATDVDGGFQAWKRAGLPVESEA